MADKKEISVEKKEVDITKQVANIAYMVRKMKNWMEEKLGADIDGDGKVGSGPFKKTLGLIVAFGLAMACYAAPHNTNIAVWAGTEATPTAYIDAAGGIHAPTLYGAVVLSSATVSGKSTLNGELEVNNSDVDINMTLSANEIDISQTNTTGQANVPLINISDNRTGGTADTAGEATIVIDADGAYGLSVADGIVNIEGEIESTGDITLDANGNEVFIDGGLHVGGTEAIGDNNLKVDGAGEITGDLTVTGGDVTGSKTNSIDIGEIADGQITLKRSNTGTVTLTTLDDDANASLTIIAGGTGDVILGDVTGSSLQLLSDDWSIGTDGTIANCTMSADQLTAGTIASAIDISAATNANASELKSGSIPAARIAAGTITAAMIDPTVVTNVLASGMVLPAVDYSAATNGAAGNIASGTLANARLDTDLQALAVNNGSALTNMAVTGFAGVVAGWSGVITNRSTLGTNTIYVYNGIITNSVPTP